LGVQIVIPPVLIVLQAILNDGAMIATAFDNSIYSKVPQRWNSKFFISISLFFGLVLIAFSSLALYLVQILYTDITNDQLKTFVYLQLSVSGHFMIFVTRSRFIFFRIQPSLFLIAAIISTQIIASFLAAYATGLMTPISWSIIGFIWLSSLIIAFVQDYVKLILYNIFYPETKFVSAQRKINDYFPGLCLLPV